VRRHQSPAPMPCANRSYLTRPAAQIPCLRPQVRSKPARDRSTSGGPAHLGQHQRQQGSPRGMGSAADDRCAIRHRGRTRSGNISRTCRSAHPGAAPAARRSSLARQGGGRRHAPPAGTERHRPRSSLKTVFLVALEDLVAGLARNAECATDLAHRFAVQQPSDKLRGPRRHQAGSDFIRRASEA
jgi:hypothetical protein